MELISDYGIMEVWDMVLIDLDFVIMFRTLLSSFRRLDLERGVYFGV